MMMMKTVTIILVMVLVINDYNDNKKSNGRREAISSEIYSSPRGWHGVKN